MNTEVEIKKTRSTTRYWVEKNGKLYARYQYRDESGNKKDKYKAITDKRTARAEVEKMRQEVEIYGSGILESDKMTFLELAEKYEAARLVEAEFENGVKVSGKTSLAPLKAPLRNLKEHFGNRKLRTIKIADVEVYKYKRMRTPVEVEHKVKINIENPPPKSRKKYEYRREIRTRPRKIASVNRELELLRAMLNFAIENDWLIVNPFSKRKGVISKAAEAERDRILSFEEEKLLLGLCVEHRKHLKPILICAVDTAMRRGEMFKMEWQQVNFEKSEIFIPKEHTKTKANRTVGMTPRLRSVLEDLINVAPPQEKPRPHDLVFGITSTIKTAWDTLIKNSGIEDLRLHDFRHTATTRMIASNSPHMEVMKITGHTQVKTFLRYLNITSETAQNVATRLNTFMEKSSADKKN